MKIAFYAPLKPPTAPTPSGDRTLARALIAAMASRGHAVEVAARLRAREPVGDPARQRRLRAVGEALADRLVRRYRNDPQRPQLWFTYHLYYKAPDWIGPRVADALGIPYVLAEASFAPKRAAGPWRDSHAAVEGAIRRADLVFGVNSANEPCLVPLLRSPDRLIRLKPFSTPPYRAPSPPSGAEREGARPVRLLTVARMRGGAKLCSYRVLADALRRVPRGWTLTVVGDGPAEAEARSLFAGLPVAFAGRQEPAAFLAAADLFVWPAVDEAFGMAIVEAQAAGLPVVAGRSGGVADTVRDGATGLLVSADDAAAFAGAVATLIRDAERRRAMGEAAALGAARFDAAADLIDQNLRALVP